MQAWHKVKPQAWHKAKVQPHTQALCKAKPQAHVNVRYQTEIQPCVQKDQRSKSLSHDHYLGHRHNTLVVRNFVV